MPDWSKALGEVYGRPFRHKGGWGIEVCPTAQQEHILQKKHKESIDGERYDDDHLAGVNAVSFDKTGFARPLRITNSVDYGEVYDMNGNSFISCKTEPRVRSVPRIGQQPKTPASAPARAQQASSEAAPRRSDQSR